MRILIDTNILIDVVARREPFFANTVKVFELCQQETVEGCIAAHSVVDMAYILRKNFAPDELRAILLRLCKVFQVESINLSKLIAALNNRDFSDFEDCLQTQCALNVHADYIVTRNIKDFAASEIPAVTPEEFLKLFEELGEQECLPTD